VPAVVNAPVLDAPVRGGLKNISKKITTRVDSAVARSSCM
jgi:hypothetical protein